MRTTAPATLALAASALLVATIGADAAPPTERVSVAKAAEICRHVVELANSDELEQHLLPFERTSRSERDAWKQQARSNEGGWYQYGLGWLNGVLSADYDGDGRLDRLGQIGGGGTCRSLNIVDLARADEPVLPIYLGFTEIEIEEDDALRWASWGGVDYFLMLDGEPTVITGRLGTARSWVRLVSWFREGRKRPLCALEATGHLTQRLTSSHGGRVCRAAMAGRIKPLVWSRAPKAVDDLFRDGQFFSESYLAKVDLDLDGASDTIALAVSHSSAGCGLDGISALRVLADDKIAPVDGLLQKALSAGFDGNEEWGPMPYGHPYPRIFEHGGRAYVLGPARTGAGVYSVWQGIVKQQCEIAQTPQFKIKKLYPLRFE